MDNLGDRQQALFRVLHEQAPPDSFGAGNTEQIILECEQALGVVLPASYKLFLREFGLADWPVEIYGLWPGKRHGLHVVRLTDRERHQVEPVMPNHLIPFSPDGRGNHYCLDTSRLLDGECPVVFWNHGMDEDQQPKQTNATFLDWLEERVQNELSD